MPNSSVKNEISRKLGKSRLFYLCRDIERASAGLLLNLHNFYIITNDNPYAKQLMSKYRNIIVLKNNGPLDTWELLKHSKTKKLIKKNDFVLVFKNTAQIEKECVLNGWRLLNPPAALASRVEEKISQIEWLGPLSKYLPDYKIDLCKNIKWDSRQMGFSVIPAKAGIHGGEGVDSRLRGNDRGRFILQFNRSHTGSGTILITSQKQSEEIKNKFPNREARIAPYIIGPLFTNNNVVWGDKILQGNISYQITGMKPFTDLPFATIGNDWALPNKILTAEQITEYRQIATDVGKRLALDGWKGLFGIDVVINEKTGRLYLLEINARQPASTTYESELQTDAGTQTVIPAKAGIHSPSCATFEAHIASLLGIKPETRKLAIITNGAQIIQRRTENIKYSILNIKNLEKNIKKFCKTGKIKIIKYDNNRPEADYLRFQTKSGIMAAHNKRAQIGDEIVSFLTATKRNGNWGAPRAGILLIKNKKILLLSRNKHGQSFYCIPAGSQEKGEDLKTTAYRETKEETNLECEIDTNKPPIKITMGILSPRHECYFWGKNIHGTARLGGPEAGYTSRENSYELEWVDLKKLPKINLLPEKLKRQINNLL